MHMNEGFLRTFLRRTPNGTQPNFVVSEPVLKVYCLKFGSSLPWNVERVNFLFSGGFTTTYKRECLRNWTRYGQTENSKLRSVPLHIFDIW